MVYILHREGGDDCRYCSGLSWSFQLSIRSDFSVVTALKI
jgi:hypothetical protein